MPFLSPSCTRCPYGTSGLSSTWLRSNFRASSLPSTLLWCAVAQDCASGVRSATEPTSCSGVLLLLIAFSRSARHSTRLPFSRHGGNSCRHRHILISFRVGVDPFTVIGLARSTLGSCVDVSSAKRLICDANRSRFLILQLE